MIALLASSFELARPGMLLALLLLAPVGWYFYYSLSDFARWQRIVSLSLRCLILLLLALALAGLSRLSPSQEKYIVVAVDNSLSVADQAKSKIEEFTASLLDKSGAHTVAFMNVAMKPTPLAENRDQLPTFKEDQRLGTNLAAAIETANAAMPPGFVPQIVLLTDGKQTEGDAVQAAAASRSPVDIVPLPVREEPEVQVADVRAPAEVRQGEPFYVEVVVTSNHDDEGFIDVYRGDIRVSQQASPLKIVPGENRFRFRQTIENESQTDYAVRARGFQDTLLDNNAASAIVFAAGKPSVLVVASDTRETNHFRWALEEQDMTVQIRPTEGLPRSLAELQKFDCLVLSNVAATNMTLKQMEIIRTYVEGLGGGLVMIGGDQSYGLGGFYKTTLEEILPVRSNFEKEKEKPSIAMVLVIDKSGSMGGTKIELAKDAARGAVELLGNRDQLGVIAFDGASYWISELHSASDRGYIIDRISTIEASGGTSIYPALSDAYDELTTATAKLKHVILLTDGHSQPGDFEGIASDMVAERITLSTVGVGEAADLELLERLAEIGGGRYYMCDDPESIPQIFAKETVEASKSAINELPFVPLVVRPTPVLSGIDLETAPFLLGYVKTRPKPTSEFILASESGDPVLVWWRYGLGMTVAFTSDAKSQWAAEWLTWPDFGIFWAQVIRNTMRKNDAKGVFVEVQRDGTNTKVIVDSVDPAGQFINEASTDLQLIRPSLKQEKMALTQTAPGRYEATFATPSAGAYHLQLAQQQRGTRTFQQTRGLVVGYPDELRLGEPDTEVMKRIADVSGGTFDPTLNKLLNDDRSVGRSSPLWPLLLTMALFVFLFDVGLRRIDLAGNA